MIILTLLGGLFVASLIGLGVYTIISKNPTNIDLGSLIPDVNDPAIVPETKFVEIPVQINGTKVATIRVPENSSKEDIEVAIFNIKEVKEKVTDKDVTNIVFVPDRIVNIVIRDRKPI